MTEASGETNSSLTPVDYFFVLRTKDRRPKPIPKVYLEKAESRYNEYTSGIQVGKGRKLVIAGSRL